MGVARSTKFGMVLRRAYGLHVEAKAICPMTRVRKMYRTDVYKVIEYPMASPHRLHPHVTFIYLTLLQLCAPSHLSHEYIDYHDRPRRCCQHHPPQVTYMRGTHASDLHHRAALRDVVKRPPMQPVPQPPQYPMAHESTLRPLKRSECLSWLLRNWRWQTCNHASSGPLSTTIYHLGSAGIETSTSPDPAVPA